MTDQIEEINRYKWIRSEQACRDLDQEAVAEWIRLYAAEFRRSWELEHGEINGICNSSGSWTNSGIIH